MGNTRNYYIDFILKQYLDDCEEWGNEISAKDSLRFISGRIGFSLDLNGQYVRILTKILEAMWLLYKMTNSKRERNSIISRYSKLINYVML